MRVHIRRSIVRRSIVRRSIVRRSVAVLALLGGGCSSWFAGDDAAPGPVFRATLSDGIITDGKDLEAGRDRVDAGNALDSKVIHDGGMPDAGSAICDPPCTTGYQCFDRGTDAMPGCLPAGEWACLPCSSDGQCLGGACADVAGEGAFCLIPCAIGSDGDSSCPTGFSCTASAAGDSCRPDTGTCTCTAAMVDHTRPCGSKAAGCSGQQTCSIDGWQPCDAPAAQAETCNGLDDDCDGKTDNGLAAKPCVATAPAGSCLGEATCQGAAGWVCDAEVPTSETCNGLDDDCDGETDEPWLNEGAYVAGGHCGVCNNDCSGVFAHGVGTCDPTGLPPYCVVAKCDPGYVPGAEGTCEPKTVGACEPCLFDLDCGPAMACTKLPKPMAGQSTACTSPCVAGECGVGLVCQNVGGESRCVPTLATCTCGPANAGATRSCSKSSASGTCTGKETCMPPLGWVGCSAKSPSPEQCNALDDDCDGGVDEQSGAGETCAKSSPLGSCPGVQVCSGAAGLFCDAKTPAAELCDGKDNDCDGATDETFKDPNTGAWTLIEHCGGCGKTCPLVDTANAKSICKIAGGKGTCSIICAPGYHDANGLANDGCECKSSSSADPPGGLDDNCDGVAGDASKAIFVAKIGKDTWPGTPDQPVRTVTKGIALAVSAGRPQVHVAAGAYVENVTLAPGVSLWGGHGKAFTVRDPVAYETLLIGSAPAVGDAITLRCSGPTGWSGGPKVDVDGFTIQGANAKAAGRSSYAVHVDRCGAALRLAHNRIVAGSGAAGASGAQGKNGAQGAAGANGKQAYDIGKIGCSAAQHNQGGSGGKNQCGFGFAAGGAGGSAICPDYNEKAKPPGCSLYAQTLNQSATWTERGKEGEGVAGGNGGMPGGDGYIDPNNGKTTLCNTPKYGCSDCVVPYNSLSGSDGKSGGAGKAGGGGGGCASALGQVAGAFWQGGTAGNGQGGSAGSGGGGGGAAGGIEVVACLAEAGYSDVGGSGAGGGAGGCGGSGGLGGGSGGASFALFVALPPGDPPGLLENLLLGGNGGPGGQGGTGGYGGAGGYGGVGGAGAWEKEHTKCASHGGKGGDGGNGGHAGGGGGGCGGPAITLGLAGPQAKQLQGAWLTTNKVVSAGQGGSGGPGGKSAAGIGKAGKAGPGLEVQIWP